MNLSSLKQETSHMIVFRNYTLHFTDKLAIQISKVCA